MAKGKRFEEKKVGAGFHACPGSNKKKSITIIAMLLLACIILQLNPIVAFFSDVIGTMGNMITGTVSFSLTELKLEDKNLYGWDKNNIYQTDEENKLVESDGFKPGDSNIFGFTLTNTGKSAIGINTTLKIVWDGPNTDLPLVNFIYLYPVNMSEEEIIDDLVKNNAGSALVNFNNNDQVNMIMNNGTSRKGYKYEIPTVYLDSALPEGQTTELSGNETSVRHEFKIVFGIRSGIGQTVEDFEIYDGENLKIDIETEATTANPSLWKMTNKATVGLKNIVIDSDNLIFDLLAEEETEYDEPGVYEFIVPITGKYKLEVWGAAGGNNGLSNTEGKGGYSTGIVNLTAGDKLYIYVGGQGKTANNNFAPGGFNGGGQGGKHSNNTAGGGGASDIRINTDSLYSRVIVAGGGGGAGSNHGTANITDKGGPGGGIEGRDGESDAKWKGFGGTQTSGGASGSDRGDEPGSFGQGGNLTKNQTGGGGGGGWYGGGSAGWEGGGGGSGWIWTLESDNAGYTSGAYTGGTWLLGSEYYLDPGAYTIAGDLDVPTYDGTGTTTGNNNDGYAKITYMNISNDIEITLKGEEEIRVLLGNNYIDDGAVLIKNGMNITNRVIKTGEVDTNTLGEYLIIYTYYDEETDTTYSVTRKVIVYATSWEFEEIGMYEYVIPVSGLYKLEVWGAQGGNGAAYSANYTVDAIGGRGGYSTGTVYLTAGTVLYVHVGGQGGSPSTPLVDATQASGGYNGGGSAEQYGNAGGGGGSDIRIETNDLYHRVIVAGRWRRRRKR